jgi:hypothetical protein
MVSLVVASLVPRFTRSGHQTREEEKIRRCIQVDHTGTKLLTQLMLNLRVVFQISILFLISVNLDPTFSSLPAHPPPPPPPPPPFFFFFHSFDYTLSRVPPSPEDLTI